MTKCCHTINSATVQTSPKLVWSLEASLPELHLSPFPLTRVPALGRGVNRPPHCAMHTDHRGRHGTCPKRTTPCWHGCMGSTRGFGAYVCSVDWHENKSRGVWFVHCFFFCVCWHFNFLQVLVCCLNWFVTSVFQRIPYIFVESILENSALPNEYWRIK
jgi:hypothetical protein